MRIDIYILSSFFINIAIILSVGVWVFYAKKQISFLYAKIWNMENEMNRHAISLEMNDMLPLPWEIEEDERVNGEKKANKGANIVYLHEE